MSREIMEAVRGLAAEKGIASEKLMVALEDALLSAYKKSPGSAKYARVELDRDEGDFRVYEMLLPPELEQKLLDEQFEEDLQDAEAAEAAGGTPAMAAGPYLDPETGEVREPEEPEISPEKFEPFRDQIEERDVTPDDFGRIAAQTAKQVILQRIREAERDMMYIEYRDRVSEPITGSARKTDH